MPYHYLKSIAPVVFVAGLLATSIVAPVSFGVASTGPRGGSDCSNLVRSGIRESSRSIDVQRAISLASQSAQFEQESKLFQLNYTDLSGTWSISKECAVTSLDYVEVYYLASVGGIVRGNYVVSEDSLLTRITNTEFQVMGTRDTGDLWSGYEIKGNSSATNPVYETTASWNVPAVQAPSGGCSPACNLSIWPGMAAVDEGGVCSGPCLIQAGTDSCVGSSPYCNNNKAYDAWWELDGSTQGVQYCANFPVSSGDSMEVDILNEYAVGGSVNQYEIYIYDWTSGKTCSPSPQPFTFSMGTPYYGYYIGEHTWTLPKFPGAFSMQGSIYYSGALRSIYQPYSNGWKDVETLWPSGCSQADITVGSISSTGSFSQTYVSSCGT